jgi:hypothetical protein
MRKRPADRGIRRDRVQPCPCGENLIHSVSGPDWRHGLGRQVVKMDIEVSARG